MKEILVRITPEMERDIKSEITSKKITSNLSVDYSVGDRLLAILHYALREDVDTVTPKPIKR